MTPQDHVEAFIASWNRLDLDAVEAALDDAIIYHNIPMEPISGKSAVSAGIRGFMADIRACDWQTHHIASAGNVVLTERSDAFTLADGRIATVRVMGTFQLSPGGKITHWRDYFDSAEMAREFGMAQAAESPGAAGQA